MENKTSAEENETQTEINKYLSSIMADLSATAQSSSAKIGSIEYKIELIEVYIRLQSKGPKLSENQQFMNGLEKLKADVKKFRSEANVGLHNEITKSIMPLILMVNANFQGTAYKPPENPDAYSFLLSQQEIERAKQKELLKDQEKKTQAEQSAKQKAFDVIAEMISTAGEIGEIEDLTTDAGVALINKLKDNSNDLREAIQKINLKDELNTSVEKALDSLNDSLKQTKTSPDKYRDRITTALTTINKELKKVGSSPSI